MNSLKFSLGQRFYFYLFCVVSLSWIKIENSNSCAVVPLEWYEAFHASVSRSFVYFIEVLTYWCGPKWQKRNLLYLVRFLDSFQKFYTRSHTHTSMLCFCRKEVKKTDELGFNGGEKWMEGSTTRIGMTSNRTRKRDWTRFKTRNIDRYNTMRTPSFYFPLLTHHRWWLSWIIIFGNFFSLHFFMCTAFCSLFVCLFACLLFFACVCVFSLILCTHAI